MNLTQPRVTEKREPSWGIAQTSLPCGFVYKRQSWLIIGLGGLSRLWETTSLDRGIWTTQESLLSMVQDTGFLHDFCFHFCPAFLPWRTVSWKWKLNRPFPPQAVFDRGTYHSNRKQTSQSFPGETTTAQFFYHAVLWPELCCGFCVSEHLTCDFRSH